jgi:hypothetical protein
MKRRSKVTWTAPAEQIQLDRKKKLEYLTFPSFYPEPVIRPESMRQWDEINIGSAVRFVTPMRFVHHLKFPLRILVPAKLSTNDYDFCTNTFAMYIGMTSVRMNRAGTAIVDRNYRTLLIGSTKYLLDDPNMIMTM